MMDDESSRREEAELRLKLRSSYKMSRHEGNGKC